MRLFTPRTRSAALLILIGLFGCSGQCNCQRDTSYVTEDTPQGRELKAVVSEQRQIVAEPLPGLPLQLEPLVIDVVHGDQGNQYRPKLIWKADGGAQALQAALRERVLARKPDLGMGKATALTLLLRYHDQQERPCGSEKVVLHVNQDRDTIILSELGKAGSPFGMKAVPESVTWLQEELTLPCKPGLAVTATVSDKGTIPVEAPAGLPIQFAPLVAQGSPDQRAPDGGKALGWQVIDSQALQSGLRDCVEADAAKLRGRRAAKLVLLLSYKDQEGRSSGTDMIELNLTQPRDWVVLPQFGVAGVPASIVVEPVTVTWPQESVIVPLGE